MRARGRDDGRVSREVTGNALADEADQARAARRRTWVRRAALLVVALVAAGWALVRIGSAQERFALPEPGLSPTASPVRLQGVLRVDGGVQGLDRLIGSLQLDNAGTRPVRLVDVAVLGLGTVIIPGSDTQTVLAPGVGRRLDLSVIPDCAARLTPSARIVASVREGDEVSTVTVTTAATPRELLSLLDPVCPPESQVALAVAVSGVQDDGDDTLAVRLVNNGRLHTQVVALAAPDASPARLVLDPKDPVPLAPGQAVVVRLRIDVPGCAVPPAGPAADALSLEARTNYGFTQVTGWPSTAVATVLRRLATRCSGHET